MTLETFQRVISDIINAVKREKKIIWLHNGLIPRLGSTRILMISYVRQMFMSIESKLYLTWRATRPKISLVNFTAASYQSF